MDHFVSSYTNRVDAKGRVSVPAAFRAILTRDASETLFCYPTLDAVAIDAGGASLVSEIYALLDELAPYSDERDELSLALFGDAENLKIDGDGRIMLPQRLRDYAGISDTVTFVGMGHKFQIWTPDNLQSRLASARRRVMEHKNLLRSRRRHARAGGNGEAGA